jgi:hypothetical protein
MAMVNAGQGVLWWLLGVELQFLRLWLCNRSLHDERSEPIGYNCIHMRFKYGAAAAAATGGQGSCSLTAFEVVCRAFKLLKSSNKTLNLLSPTPQLETLKITHHCGKVAIVLF